MNLQESIRRILREDHQFIRKHISDTNPHTGARNAFMGIPSLSRYEWNLIPKLIYPDDEKINKEMLYPASKRDVKRYMKQYIQGSEFPAIVLIDNGKEYSIADGQHRLSAAIKLGVPIYAYVGTEKPKLQESIRRILREEAGLPLYLKRRIGLRELEHDFNMLINFEIKSVRNRDLSLEEFKRMIVSTLMDIFHGALSDWGKVDFDYDYIYDSLMNYFSPRITEKYIEHLYNG